MAQDVNTGTAGWGQKTGMRFHLGALVGEQALDKQHGRRIAQQWGVARSGMLGRDSADTGMIRAAWRRG